MKHLLASDFDGTLFQNREINPNDIKAIREFREKGNLFVICTGRQVESVLNKLNEHHIPFDYIIALNGALAVDRDKKIIYEHQFDLKSLEKLKEELKHEDILEYQCSDGFISVLGSDTDKEMIDDNKVKGYYITTENEEKALEVAEYLNDSINKLKLKAYPNYKFVSIGMKSIHKGYGVNRLAELIGFKGNIHTVGDDYNDIPMFKDFNSFGIATGSKEAIKYAKHKVDTVYEVINHID